MPVALGQTARQRAEAERAERVVALPSPNSAPPIAPSAGHDQHAAGLAGEVVRLRPGDRCGVERRRRRDHPCGQHGREANGERLRREFNGHRGRPFIGADAEFGPLNHPLGLTEYFCGCEDGRQGRGQMEPWFRCIELQHPPGNLASSKSRAAMRCRQALPAAPKPDDDRVDQSRRRQAGRPDVGERAAVGGALARQDLRVQPYRQADGAALCDRAADERRCRPVAGRDAQAGDRLSEGPRRARRLRQGARRRRRSSSRRSTRSAAHRRPNIPTGSWPRPRARSSTRWATPSRRASSTARRST